MEIMIAEYRQSLGKLRRRIGEINDKLAERTPLAPGESFKTLETRRYLLYREAWEMEEAIGAMEEYLPSQEEKSAV